MIASIGTRDTHSQPLRGRTAPISFHSVQCVLDGGELTTLNILEEFLSSEKPELDTDTAIAEKVLRTSKMKAGQAPLPLTYVRYGYASTVHHAQGMSQAICYVNCDHAAGRHSDGFFRWLYSALTIAERELVLLNFTEIHHFDAAVWNANAVKVDTDLTIGTGWSFQPDGAASERDQHRELPPGLDQSKDLLKSVSIWLRIANAAEQTGWRVVNAACHAYQEQYDLLGPEGEECQLRIAYNGKNVVTAMHAKDQAQWQLLCGLASRCVELNSYSTDAVGLLGSIRLRLGRSGFKLVSAIETPYRLLTTVARENSERVSLEVNFDKQGLVSSVRPLLCSHIGLHEVIRDALL